MLSYPRRQQYRRAVRAGVASALSGGAALLAVVAARSGLPQIAGLMTAVAAGLGLRARHWARLAGRARVGARSEEQVQRVLAPLLAEGWRLRHSLAWQGRGDVDSVAIAPNRMAFAIETKTSTYAPQDLERVREVADWLRRRRRTWCRGGALPILCVVRERRLERVEAGVLVVSLDRLPGALRTASRTRQRPRFLSATKPSGDPTG